MLLVLCEQSAVLGDFNLDLRILFALWVQQVEGGSQDRDALFVAIHVLLVGIGHGLDLLGELVHVGSEHFVNLLALSGAADCAVVLSSSLDHTNCCVDLSDAQFDKTKQAKDGKTDLKLLDRLLMDTNVEDLVCDVLLSFEEKSRSLLKLDFECLN